MLIKKPIRNINNFLILIVFLYLFYISLKLLLNDNLDITWNGDYGIYLINLFNSSTFDQSLGISSRFGWSHPGALNYYLILPFNILFGEDLKGIIIGTFTLNIIFLFFIYLITYKLFNKTVASYFIFITILFLIINMGERSLYDPLLPYATLIPWVLIFVLFFAVLFISPIYLVSLVFCLSLVTQMHVSLWLSSMVLSVSTIILFLYLSKDKKYKTLLYIFLSILFFVVLWIPAIAEFDNLSKIFNFFLNREVVLIHGFKDAFDAFSQMISLPFFNEPMYAFPMNSNKYHIVLGYLLIIMSIVMTLLSVIMREKKSVVVGLMIFILMFTEIYSLTRFAGPITPHSVTYFSLTSLFVILQGILLFPNIKKIIAILFLIYIIFNQFNFDSPYIYGNGSEKLSLKLVNQLKKCSKDETGTIFVDHSEWEREIAAISYAHRQGYDFNISPHNWTIVFGGEKIKSSLITSCQIRFFKNKKNLLDVNVLNIDKKKLVKILDTNNTDLIKFGDAEFNENKKSICSSIGSDSGYVTQKMNLESKENFYKIEFLFDAKLQENKYGTHTAHLSILGDEILVPIIKGEYHNKFVSLFYKSKEKPFQIVFGLGGWTKGKGCITMKNLKISILNERAIK